MSEMVERVVTALVTELGCIDGDMQAAARAAIAAMREPTEEMVATARRNAREEGGRKVWRTMIDEALRDPTSPGSARTTE